MPVMRPSDVTLNPKQATARWFRTVFNNTGVAGRNIIAYRSLRTATVNAVENLSDTVSVHRRES